MMKLNGNTILITGGGSGIGLALAEEFSRMDNRVIVAGRTPEKLRVAEKKGFKTFSVDMSNPASIHALAEKVTQEFPRLNVVIHNAGIAKAENLIQGGNSKVQEEIVLTNFLGPMRLTDALLPHLLKQSSATIMTVSSGLAFVPNASNPTYSATKAALHSYSQSLRFQLKDTSVKVIEIAPPYVQTCLGGEFQATDPNAMPLKDFSSEVMQILKSDPHVEEVLVMRVHPHRFAAEKGRVAYEAFFKQYNQRLDRDDFPNLP
jgi:uncharacterized oxidoreductase